MCSCVLESLTDGCFLQQGRFLAGVHELMSEKDFAYKQKERISAAVEVVLIVLLDGIVFLLLAALMLLANFIEEAIFGNLGSVILILRFIEMVFVVGAYAIYVIRDLWAFANVGKSTNGLEVKEAVRNE